MDNKNKKKEEKNNIFDTKTGTFDHQLGFFFTFLITFYLRE